jgi:hypothetical protein
MGDFTRPLLSIGVGGGRRPLYISNTAVLEEIGTGNISEQILKTNVGQSQDCLIRHVALQTKALGAGHGR